MGLRVGMTDAEREELATLRRETRELKCANAILQAGSTVFGAELDGRAQKSSPSSMPTGPTSPARVSRHCPAPGLGRRLHLLLHDARARSARIPPTGPPCQCHCATIVSFGPDINRRAAPRLCAHPLAWIHRERYGSD